MWSCLICVSLPYLSLIRKAMQSSIFFFFFSGSLFDFVLLVCDSYCQKPSSMILPEVRL